jgi:hypothetical protein
LEKPSASIYPDDGGRKFLQNTEMFYQLHDVTSQKTVIITVSTVRTSFIAKMSESFPERSQISELKFNYN